MPTANVNGIKLNYEITGEGEPVVLITGFAGTTVFWNNAVPLLSDNYKVITLDNRGAGLTKYDGQFTIPDLADDVVALMDHLLIFKAHVVGWSMGTTIAHRMALKYPERIDTLTFISPYAKRPARSSYIMNTAIQLVQEGGDFDHFSKILNSFCFSEDVFTQKEKKGSKIKLSPKMDINGIADQMKALDPYDGRWDMKDVPFKVLVIHGTKDIMVPPWIGEKIAATLKGSKLIMVPGAGHIIHPSDYIAFVKEHISRK